MWLAMDAGWMSDPSGSSLPLTMFRRLISYAEAIGCRFIPPLLPLPRPFPPLFFSFKSIRLNSSNRKCFFFIQIIEMTAIVWIDFQSVWYLYEIWMKKKNWRDGYLYYSLPSAMFCNVKISLNVHSRCCAHFQNSIQLFFLISSNYFDDLNDFFLSVKRNLTGKKEMRFFNKQTKRKHLLLSPEIT